MTAKLGCICPQQEWFIPKFISTFSAYVSTARLESLPNRKITNKKETKKEFLVFLCFFGSLLPQHELEEDGINIKLPKTARSVQQMHALYWFFDHHVVVEIWTHVCVMLLVIDLFKNEDHVHFQATTCP
jgi:hypothetical protein